MGVGVVWIPTVWCPTHMGPPVDRHPVKTLPTPPPPPLILRNEVGNCIPLFQIQLGRAYLAFTEYDRKSGVGTVAFKDVEDVAYYRALRGVPGSSHLVHYHMVHGEKPILGDWKIFTGEGEWCVCCNGKVTVFFVFSTVVYIRKS